MKPRGFDRKLIALIETSVTLRSLGARLKTDSEGHLDRIACSLADLADHPGRRSFEKSVSR